MANDRDRLQKVLTLAMHPQTVPQEVHAAFLRARQIVKANPSLAHSPAPEAVSAAKPPREATFEATITSVHPDWVLILVDALSRSAYKLDLKYQIAFQHVKVSRDGQVNVAGFLIDSALAGWRRAIVFWRQPASS